MSTWTQFKLYNRAPTWVQSALCTAQGWKLRRVRYGRTFERLLATYERRTFLKERELRELRDGRLAAFVKHAHQHVPFYREWFGDHGVRPETIRSHEDLDALPRLTKSVVRDAQERGSFSVAGFPVAGAITAHTSGTTGAGLRFLVSREAVREQWAVWWRYRRWHGITDGMWCGYFGGRLIVPVDQRAAPYWRYNLAGRQILFSGYHLSAQTVHAYAGALRRIRPPWLHGYPSSIALLARLLLENGIELGYAPRYVTLGAENVLASQVRIIEQVFGVTPRQHYGMAEGVANVSECPLGKLHVDEDFAAVEIALNARGGCSVLGTNLSNPLTPLIRYDTGDIARLADVRCSCGRNGRVMEALDGRKEDYIVLPNGAVVGRLDHVFKDLDRVREAQLVQPRAGSLIARVVRGPGYADGDETHLRHDLMMHLHPDMDLRIEYVDTLPRTSNGKLRFVVSRAPIG